jgi:hypothetical protein
MIPSKARKVVLVRTIQRARKKAEDEKFWNETLQGVEIYH